MRSSRAIIFPALPWEVHRTCISKRSTETPPQVCYDSCKERKGEEGKTKEVKSVSSDGGAGNNRVLHHLFNVPSLISHCSSVPTVLYLCVCL